MQEAWVQSLGQDESLEEGMSAHSSILAWRVQWTEEPGRPQSMGSHRVGHDWATNIHSCIYMCVCIVTQPCPTVQLFAILWTVVLQAPLSMKFTRPEYWSGKSCPSPGDLPNPGIKPWSPALQADSPSSEPPRMLSIALCFSKKFFASVINVDMLLTCLRHIKSSILFRMY